MASQTPSGVLIRTAVDADLPQLQAVYRAASLSNEGDAPLLLAQPQYLVFAGAGIADGRTRVAVDHSQSQGQGQNQGQGRVVGFATLATGQDGEPELEDLFVDPDHRRRGIALRLVRDVAGSARAAGHQHLWVVGNPHALAFYRAAGFVDTGQVRTALGEGLRLRLPLGSGEAPPAP